MIIFVLTIETVLLLGVAPTPNEEEEEVATPPFDPPTVRPTPPFLTPRDPFMLIFTLDDIFWAMFVFTLLVADEVHVVS